MRFGSRASRTGPSARQSTMSRSNKLAAAGVFIAWAACSAQEQPAPPTIALYGITNAASLMPPQLAGGALAPGSLVRIRGWRLGPGVVKVRISRDGKDVDAAPAMASDREVRVVLPANVGTGAAEIRVIRDGIVSATLPIKIAAAS